MLYNRPPVAEAGFIPIDVEEDEIEIEFDLEEGEVEIKGPGPDGLLAEIEEYGGLLVSDGQYIRVELSDDLEYELKFDDSILEVEAPEVTLRVIATDTEGESDTATASPVFAQEGDDDDD